MKERCYNKNRHNYHRYGGRGIEVCDEWLNDKLSFINWSIEHGFEESLTLERINNDLGYSPDNCKWIPANKQQNNRCTSMLITYNGKTQYLSWWAKELNFKRTTIQRRLKIGMTFEEALIYSK